VIAGGESSTARIVPPALSQSDRRVPRFRIQPIPIVICHDTRVKEEKR
jgi:hypothetical protein